jgi:hypothetical protein
MLDFVFEPGQLDPSSAGPSHVVDEAAQVAEHDVANVDLVEAETRAQSHRDSIAQRGRFGVRSGYGHPRQHATESLVDRLYGRLPGYDRSTVEAGSGSPAAEALVPVLALGV